MKNRQLGNGCKSRLLFAKIAMAIWFQVSGMMNRYADT